MKYKLTSTMTIVIETILDDAEIPEADTVEALLEEDLQDLGYDVYAITTQKFDRQLIED